MTTNNFDYSLKKIRRKAQKAVKNQQFTEFFVLNKQRKVIEFLLTTDNRNLLDIFFKNLVPEELKDFVSVKLRDDSEEIINHWYFEKEVLVIVLSIDWGDNKQDISIELDSEQFEMLILNSSGLNIKVLDYKLLNDFLINFLKRQAESVTKTFNELKEDNLEQSNKEKSSLKEYF